MGVVGNFLKSKSKLSYAKFLVQRSFKKNSSRLKVARMLALTSPKVSFNQDESRYTELQSENPLQIANQLKSEGIKIFSQPFFSDTEIANVLNELEGEELCDPYSGASGFSSENIPDEVNCAHYKRESLSKLSEIVNLANDPGMLSVAKAYLGAAPTISNINLWWGTYGEEEPKDNELFHRDKDDYDFMKFFIYLTDTDENDYNIVYVKNSLNSDKALDKLRYTRDEVEKMFGKENVVHAVGPKGTGFVGANYGVHNGTLPPIKGRKTLLLQIEYSIGAIPIENYSPISRADIKGTMINNVDKWVNRLIIKG